LLRTIKGEILRFPDLSHFFCRSSIRFSSQSVRPHFCSSLSNQVCYVRSWAWAYLSHSSTTNKVRVSAIELHAPTNSTQKLKLVVKGGQFTYSPTSASLMAASDIPHKATRSIILLVLWELWFERNDPEFLIGMNRRCRPSWLRSRMNHRLG
jgi:hypothetical protein